MTKQYEEKTFSMPLAHTTRDDTPVEIEPIISMPLQHTLVKSSSQPSLGKSVVEEPHEYTVTDFETNPENIKRFELLTDYYEKHGTAYDLGAWGGNDDMSEFMRDRVMRISTLISDKNILENAPDNIKQAYNDLKDDWDKAEISGFGEGLEATKDYLTDFVASPEGILTLLSLVPTGGASLALGGAGVVAKTAQAGKVLKPIKEVITKKPILAGTAYGAAETGTVDYLEQDVEIATGRKTKIEFDQVALATAMGAGFGAALGGVGYGIGKGWQAWKNRSPVDTSRQLEDLTVDEIDPSTEIVKSLETADPSFINTTTATNIETIKGIEDFFESAEEITEKQLQDSKDFQRFIREIGGGQATQDKVLGDLLAAAEAESTGELTGEVKRQLLKHATNFTSKIAFGKATAFITPYMDASPTAKVLADLITKEYQIGTKAGQQKVVHRDLSEEQRSIFGGLLTRYYGVTNDIAEFRRSGILDTLEVKYQMNDDVNDALMKAMRGVYSSDRSYSKAVNTTAIRMKQLYSNIGDMLADANPKFQKIDNYVPREWKRSAIEKNKEKFAKLLMEDGQAKTKKKAYRMINEMLDVKNQLYTGSGSGSGSFFLNKRKFNDLEYDAKYQEFLNDDVHSGFVRYIEGASNMLAKKRVLGVSNEDEFMERWINGSRKDLKNKGFPVRNTIKDDMEEAGLELTKAERERFRDLYRGLTGEGLNPSGVKSDSYALANRLAYLPLATVSSLTEILLNFGQAGTVNTLKGIHDAANMSFKRVTNNQHKELMDDFGLTANEAYLEMQRFGLVMEQALTSMTDRLAGEGLGNQRLQNVSNKFFRLNFLDQWTKFVQTTSFISGKHMIMDNVKLLAKTNGKINSKRAMVAKDRLADLGIDADEALQWYKKGATTKNEWYVSNILQGAARYSGNVIIDVSRQSGVKPRAFTSGLQGDTSRPLVGQLMGYPTAFTNTILKQGYKQLVRDKHVAAEKLVPTAMLMTFVAGYNNWVRDKGGEDWDKKSVFEVGAEAAARWGGLTMMYDTYKRAKQGGIFTRELGAYPAAFVGPIGTDAIKFLHGDFASLVGQKIPGYTLGKTAFGKDTMRDYTSYLRSLDYKIKGELFPDWDTGSEFSTFVGQ